MTDQKPAKPRNKGGRPKGAKDKKPRYSASRARQLIKAFKSMGVNAADPRLEAIEAAVSRIEDLKITRNDAVLSAMRKHAAEVSVFAGQLMAWLDREMQKSDDKRDQKWVGQLVSEIRMAHKLLDDIHQGIAPYFHAKYGAKDANRDRLPKPNPVKQEAEEAANETPPEPVEVENEQRSNLLHLRERYGTGRKLSK